jgi:hypothetical protein
MAPHCGRSARFPAPFRLGVAFIYFPSILDIEPRLFQPIEQKSGVRVHDLFRPVDFGHGALKGSPAHPLWLFDVITDTAIRPELSAQLESTPQSPVMGCSRWQR